MYKKSLFQHFFNKLPYKVHKLLSNPKKIAGPRIVPIYNEE